MIASGQAGSEAAKEPHELHVARSGAELERLLERDHGIAVDALLGTHGLGGGSHGVLVVGSIAEGMGTPSSDVDLLVLVDGELPPARVEATTVQAKWTRELLLYEAGVEINVEVVTRHAMADALRAFIDVAPLLYEGQSVSTMPIVGLVERHLLHRLRSGWIVGGAAVVERWRDEFLVALLPPYLALLRFVSFNEMLEDASAQLASSDGSFSIMARESAGEALFSLLAIEGTTNQQSKWVARLATDGVGPVHPEAFEELMRILFLPRELASEERQETLDSLERIGRYVGRVLDDSPHVRAAAAAVLDQIHYTTRG